ncbi:MAG: 50S ribosomal protein L1 [Candidatus Lernaella stagnicola]|nr:50S ribosomal protein L1 [Candidatus Lernaella stagnicola]
MPKHGKKYRETAGTFDPEQRYPVDEALTFCLEGGVASFDESVDAVFRLGVNPKHADQMVRGSCLLPHGTGKNVRVIVFAEGDKAREAEQGGADVVGSEDLVKRIQDGWLEFDRVIATPDMMRVVSKLGRVLGPRGLMPNPKSGTVTFDVGQAVDEVKKGKIEFRVDKGGNLHAPIGRRSFKPEQLRENLLALADTLVRLKPPTSKGTYMRNVSISSTMGPGVRVDPSDIQAALR